MNSLEKQNEVVVLKESLITPLFKTTLLSKYLAAFVFIVLPFIGGIIGYNLAIDRMLELQENVTPQLSEFSAEELAEFRQFKLEKKLQGITVALQNKLDQEKIDQATSTINVLATSGRECTIEMPTNTYEFGTTYGNYTLTKHIRSCLGNWYENKFTFSGKMKVRGEISNPNAEEEMQTFSITDPDFIKSLPNNENGISEIEASIYKNIYAPEFWELTKEAKNNPEKIYVIEVTLSDLIISHTAKANVVSTNLLDEPKIIEVIN